MNYLKSSFFLLIAFTLNSTALAKRPNVLFIIADDLMKQIEVYGDNTIKTPELNKLAQESMIFDRAYCQYPLCGPSRAALMLSCYPDKSGLTWNQGGKSSSVQKKGLSMGIKTMPAYFKANGYITVGGGKLYHNSVMPDTPDSATDFSVVLSNAGHDGKKVKIPGSKTKSTHIIESSDLGIYEHKDGATVKRAKQWLSQHASSNNEQPFFMSIGIKKPHSPYSCPKEFYDLYVRKNMHISTVKAPENILTHYSLSKPSALLKVHADTKMYDAYSLPMEKKKEMIHGYQACVTYADYLVGDLIRSLKENKLYDNTIVVFTSDHGYKLGEYDRWAKYTLHEKDAVVPFLVRAPQYQATFGQKTNAIVGLIDIYPTLAELCGIPIPEKIDGKSFAKTLQDNSASERDFIRTVLPRAATESHPRAAGISIFHKSGYRYHQWWEGELNQTPSKESIAGYELYDHYNQNNTPISLKNIAKQHPEIIEKMHQIASKELD